jgi:hypothetical protein
MILISDLKAVIQNLISYLLPGSPANRRRRFFQHFNTCFYQFQHSSTCFPPHPHQHSNVLVMAPLRFGREAKREKKQSKASSSPKNKRRDSTPSSLPPLTDSSNSEQSDVENDEMSDQAGSEVPAEPASSPPSSPPRKNHVPNKLKDRADFKESGHNVRDCVLGLMGTGEGTLTRGNGIQDQHPNVINAVINNIQERSAHGKRLCRGWCRFRIREYLKTLAAPLIHPNRKKMVKNKKTGKTHQYEAKEGKYCRIDLTGEDNPGSEEERAQPPSAKKAKQVKKETAAADADPAAAGASRRRTAAPKAPARECSPAPVIAEIDYSDLALGVKVGIGLRGQTPGDPNNDYLAFGTVSVHTLF